MQNASDTGAYDYGVGTEELESTFPGCIGINGTANTSILTQSIASGHGQTQTTILTSTTASTKSTSTTKQGFVNSVTSAIASHLTATVNPTGTANAHSGANHVAVLSAGVFGVVLIGAAVFL